jgi:hypothetical protein
MSNVIEPDIRFIEACFGDTVARKHHAVAVYKGCRRFLCKRTDANTNGSKQTNKPFFHFINLSKYDKYKCAKFMVTSISKQTLTPNSYFKQLLNIEVSG